MKTTYLLLALSVCSFLGCQPPAKENQEESVADFVTLEKLWETDTVLYTPESVIYDDFRDVLYVSNIAGTPPDTLDYDGFISILSTDGEIIEREWVTGISSIKGMGIVDSSLFVTDLLEVVEIDIPTGEILKTYPAEDAGFLNDITVGPDKTVYVSDSRKNNIHQVKNGEISLWHTDSTYNGSNGLLYDNGKIMVAGFNSGDFFELDPMTKTSKIVADSILQGDGINVIEDGYIVSCWRGVIWHVKANGDKKIILDTQNTNKQSADAWYDAASNVLYVPTFFGNTVAAYKVLQ